MTRQVVLDTETTGLAVEKGHRVIEIGCLEIVERRSTGRRFHRYLNPQREIDPGALEVTGLTFEFLSDKPLFADVAHEFVEFIRGAELIIHNAAFDVAFLDAELARAGGGFGRIAELAQVTDSLAMARERYPGQRNSLDALCRRLGIDNAHRRLHGALLDAELLADVYLAMTAGQGALLLEPVSEMRGVAIAARGRATGLRLRVLHANSYERQEHASRLAAVAAAAGGRCLWPLDPGFAAAAAALESPAMA